MKMPKGTNFSEKHQLIFKVNLKKRLQIGTT